MIEAAVAWAKEYGDVLSTVGFLFAITTVMLTNGRIILQRVRGGQVPTITAIPEDGLSLPENSATDVAVLADAPPPTPTFNGQTSVAITPFKELGNVTDHFAEGVAEDLVADLQTMGFATAARDTTSKIAAAGADTQALARDLGVQYVIAGSIRQQDAKNRIAAQLMDRTGATLWSDRFDVVGDDVMAMQESVAAKIAKAVQNRLSGDHGLLGSDDTAAGLSLYKTQDEALAATVSPKSRFIAFLLCFFVVGLFGAHRFYVGRPYTGILYVFTVGLFTFGWFFDLILISLGMFADGQGRPVRLFHPKRTFKHS